MLRGSWIVALMGLLLSGAAMAAEPAMCKSICDAERRSCKAEINGLAQEKFNGLIMLESRDRNELARTAGMTRVATPAAQANERSGVQTRRLRYAAACEEKYVRCTRGCATPLGTETETETDSPVIIKRPKPY